MMAEQSTEQNPLPTNLPSEEVCRIFRQLRALKAKHCSTTNKHELATILIGACILEGINTGKRITGALEKLGLNRQHAGKILVDGAGDEPQHYYWRRTTEGTYALH